MDILKTLLADDPGTPRLTCYDETTGGRIDLSAQTLDNWASKIANMLHDEFDVEPGDAIWIDLPVIWQTPCLVLGCERAGVEISKTDPVVVFTTVGKLSIWEERCPDAYLAAVTEDAFGRGVVECGGTIPPGVIDFGPEVRFHPDAYMGTGGDETQPLLGTKSVTDLIDSALAHSTQIGLENKARILSRGWLSNADDGVDPQLWAENILASWVKKGAAVVVRGGDDQRLARIADIEKTTLQQ